MSIGLCTNILKTSSDEVKAQLEALAGKAATITGGVTGDTVAVGRWCADSARWASSGRHVDHRDRRRVMISM